MPFDPLDPNFDPADLSPDSFYLVRPENLFQNSNGTGAVTADGDPVGYMADLSGNGHHLVQSTANARPLYKTDGTLHWLEFDGSNDFLAVSYTQAQPLDRVIGFRAITFSDADTLWDGFGGNNCRIYQAGGTEDLRAFAGTGEVVLDGEPATGTDSVITERWDGAGSRWAFDTDAYTENNAGTASSDGYVLGCFGDRTQVFGNLRYYAGIEKSVFTDDEINQLRSYMAFQQGRAELIPELEEPDIAITPGSYKAYRKRIEEEDEERDDRWRKQREKIERIGRLVDGVQENLPDDVPEAQVAKRAEVAVEKAAEKLVEDVPAFDYARLGRAVRAAERAAREAQDALDRYEARKRREMEDEQDDEDVLLLMS